MTTIKSATAVYFSATYTTKSIVDALFRGLGCEPELVDLTFPEARISPIPKILSDLLIVAVPVYEEVIPKFLMESLNSLCGNDQPAILVAVYGNVGPGIVLKQLASIVEKAGFHVKATASFIGEHSFSHPGFEIAANRPDKEDLAIAQNFGKIIADNLKESDLNMDCNCVNVYGKLPLMAKILPKDSARLFTKQPQILPVLCIHCGICVKKCPMGAIDVTTLEITEQMCIRCFSCVKKCPRDAREIILKKRFLVSRALGKALTRRRDPRITYFW